MSERVWHHSWSGMRGIKPRRKWMTWGEFDGSLRIFGVTATPYQVRRILASDPPEKVNGAYRYEMRHLELVRKHMNGKDTNGLAAG